MSSWLNLNESLNSLKGQLTTFATNVLAEGEGEQTPDANYEELKRICVRQELEIEELRKRNEELQRSKSSTENQNGDLDPNSWEWGTSETPPTTSGDEISNLKKVIEDLEREKRELICQLDQLDSEHQQNVSELVKIKERLQDENANLADELKRVRESKLARELDETKTELSVLKSTHRTLEKTLENAKSENESIAEELRKTRAELRSSKELNDEEDAKNCQKLAFILETYEKQVSDLKRQLEELKTPPVADNETLHKTYVNIITENVKRYTQSTDPHVEASDDPHVLEFSKHVENIFNILTELKTKCERLENENLEISREKTRILNEKNHEIEKLMQNSEELSQEIMSKSDVIKELENENYELGKNNELLMAELNEHKNAGLQTISESNEDNMVLLESQLENANRRIKELEETLGSSLETGERSMPDGAAEPQVEAEVRKTERDYRELLNSFDDLKIDYDLMKNELENTKNDLELADKENEELRGHLERVRADFENTEYQLTEANITIDTLHEELENCKGKIDRLVEENRQLSSSKTESEKNVIDAKLELNNLRELLLNEENQRRELECRITHDDALRKDYSALVDAKNGMEETMRIMKQSVDDYEVKYTDLLKKYDLILLKCEDLNAELLRKENDVLKVENELKELQMRNGELEKTIDNKECKLLSLDGMLKDLQQEREELKQAKPEDFLVEEKIKLEQQLQEITNSRNELIALVTTKHQESLAYHNEIQRLSQLLKLESEKCVKLEANIEELNDQINFLKEKCDIMGKQVLEKSGPSEKELSLAKQLERLQSHLMEIEEHYTQELLQVEQKNAELQAKMNELQQREKDSSTMYTSVSIRANQQVETLQNQLQTVTAQRDELRRKISDAEDQNTKQAAALANLQFVLEQFQRDKEKDVIKETERIRRQITLEKKVQDELRNEIAGLKSQLEESKQGLQAASRLSDQLELSKKQNASLKDEVTQLQEKLSKSERTVFKLTNQTEGKVDKTLLKNLLVGFLSSGNANNWNKDQIQILKIIATVLDFNQQDHDKVKLNKPQQGWLGSMLFPQSAPTSISQESLSQAFIKFLENESKPRQIPSLLDEPAKPSTSKQNTPRASPIVLSEIVLPSFADFGQSRNSSSILKDVLKDNS